MLQHRRRHPEQIGRRHERHVIASSSCLSDSFGRHLRELRLKYGITQEQLAALAGLAGPYISVMERGIKVPSLTTVLRLALALDCKVAKLVTVFDYADLRSILPK
jgi:transcriptional regulator with XRE-family HTH domain